MVVGVSRRGFVIWKIETCVWCGWSFSLVIRRFLVLLTWWYCSFGCFKGIGMHQCCIVVWVSAFFLSWLFRLLKWWGIFVVFRGMCIFIHFSNVITNLVEDRFPLLPGGAWADEEAPDGSLVVVREAPLSTTPIVSEEHVPVKRKKLRRSKRIAALKRKKSKKEPPIRRSARIAAMKK